MRSDAVYEVARGDRSRQPAEPHAQPDVCQPGNEMFSSGDIEGEALTRRLVHRAHTAASDRKCEEVPDQQDVEEEQRADADHEERHDQVQQANEQAAVNHVGDGARRNAEEEQRRHSKRKGDSDHEGIVGEVEDQPAEHDLLAHVSDGVEEGGGHQHAQIAVAQGGRGTERVPKECYRIGGGTRATRCLHSGAIMHSNGVMHNAGTSKEAGTLQHGLAREYICM